MGQQGVAGAALWLVAKCWGRGWGAPCQAEDLSTSARSAAASALLGACGLLWGGGRGWTPLCQPGDVLGRAPRASGKRVLKVQASTWVSPAAVTTLNLSLPPCPHRCCLPAGAERSGDPLRRDGEYGGKEPEQHHQLSRTPVLGPRGAQAAQPPVRLHRAWQPGASRSVITALSA